MTVPVAVRLFAAKSTLDGRLTFAVGAALTPILRAAASVSAERVTVTDVEPPTATVIELGETVNVPDDVATSTVAVALVEPEPAVPVIVELPAATPRTVTEADRPPAGIVAVVELTVEPLTKNPALAGVPETSVTVVLLD